MKIQTFRKCLLLSGVLLGLASASVRAEPLEATSAEGIKCQLQVREQATTVGAYVVRAVNRWLLDEKIWRVYVTIEIPNDPLSKRFGTPIIDRNTFEDAVAAAREEAKRLLKEAGIDLATLENGVDRLIRSPAFESTKAKIFHLSDVVVDEFEVTKQRAQEDQGTQTLSVRGKDDVPIIAVNYNKADGYEEMAAHSKVKGEFYSRSVQRWKAMGMTDREARQYGKAHAGACRAMDILAQRQHGIPAVLFYRILGDAAENRRYVPLIFPDEERLIWMHSFAELPAMTLATLNHRITIHEKRGISTGPGTSGLTPLAHDFASHIERGHAVGLSGAHSGQRGH